MVFREVVGDSQMSGVKLMRGGEWLHIARVLLERYWLGLFCSDGDLGPEHWHLSDSPGLENRRLSRLIPLLDDGSIFLPSAYTFQDASQCTYRTRRLVRGLVHICGVSTEMKAKFKAI